MNGYLRQSSAGQVRTIGPFIDSTDFATLENALTIAATDIKLKKNGAASGNKNSGGATADGAGGLYAVTWDATDTATVGELYFSIQVSGSLVVFGSYTVLTAAAYDATFASAATGYVADQPVNVTKWAGTATTTGDIALKTTLAKTTHITGFNDISTANVQAELVTYGALKPTTAGRTLDITATGEAGIDWANIGAPTTTVALTGTTIGTVTNLTNDPPGVTTLLTRVSSTIFTGITSLKEWLGLLAGKQVGNSTARTEIRSTGAGGGTYDETTDSQEAIRDRGDTSWITGTTTDPWTVALPGAYGAGTAGNIVGTNLNATVSSRATPAQVQTELGTYGALKPTVAARTLDVSATGEAGVDWANVGSPTTSVNLSATTIANATNVTNPVTLTAAYDAAKTAATQTSVNTIDDFLDTEMAAVKTTTDKLDTALELDGAVYRYTTNALEQAPSGGSGGATAGEIADAVWDEPLSGHLTAGSAGAALNGAGSAGDPWTTVLPGAYGAGTAGNIVGNRVDVAVSTRATPAQVQSELGTYGALKPTTPGQTLDVSAGGEAGVDWANVGGKTTTNALTNTTIATVTTLTNAPPDSAGITTLLTRIPAALFAGITSLAQWLGLIAGKQVGNATARTELRATGAGGGSYDETTDSQEAIRDRGDASWITGTATDPWAVSLPGAYSAGQAGKIVGDNLNATVSSRATQTSVDTVSTNVSTLLTRITSTLFSGITSLSQWLGLLAGKQSGNTTARTELRATGAGSGTFDETTDSQEAIRDRGDAAWITGGAGSDPWAVALPGAYGAGTAGKILGTNLDATVSSRLPTSSYVAPDNAGITAIKSKTDNLPADPADASDIAASFTVVNGKLDPIKAKTDTIPANPASVSDVPTAIQNADALLKRDMAAVIGEASRSPLNAMRLLRNKWSAVETPNTLTVKKEDDATTAWTAPLTTDSNAAPITGMDPG